ncbi:hypothetical protein FIBSPDRAFT_901033 [Athelia psychrophila]|uniref:Cyclin N-terminal domain-containing protein n=1 Tax=Athelia psychrophila TaxID=1759441 RepID=A0A165XMS0_9AGAM|nr:hypothetical protein FIBSPDRAFT_901033 [Fibularhizoctonia sp. CBS 109695]
MSASPSTSRLHEASLVDASLHSPALLELLDIKITRPVIQYVVDTVIETVDYAMGVPSTSTPRGRSASRAPVNPLHASFATFATTVLTRAEVTAPTLLVALAYIDRAKPHLHIALAEWACERVFLGALMLASKYANDSTLKNVHWALCTGVFGKRDVGRIERELLDVLDWELGVSEADTLAHHEGLSAVALGRKESTAVGHVHKHAPRHHHRATHTPDSLSPPSLSPSSSTSSSLASSVTSYSPQTPAHTHTHVPAPAKSMDEKHAMQSPHSRVADFTQTTLDILRAFPAAPAPTYQPHHQTHHHHSALPLAVMA